MLASFLLSISDAFLYKFDDFQRGVTTNDRWTQHFFLLSSSDVLSALTVHTVYKCNPVHSALLSQYAELYCVTGIKLVVLT